MRLALCVAAVLAAAACGPTAPKESESPTNENDKATTPSAPETPPAIAAIPVDSAWTGRFAATPDHCESGGWTIGAKTVTTAGETACDVQGVARLPGQARLSLQCTESGANSLQEWTLTPGADGALAVTRRIGSETFDVALRRCG